MASITTSRSKSGISPHRSTSVARTGNYGWLPVLFVISAVAVLLLGYTYNAARAGAGEWTRTLLWGCLLLMFVPTALRLCQAEAGRYERLGLLLLLGVSLYMAKVLHSPTMFTFGDELQHWRTAHDILQSGRLFSENPLLTVSPLYPGMEIITTALAQLSGVDIFTAGIITIAIARILFLLTLFGIFEKLSGSHRVAGLGVLIYMTNPMFLYFGAQFAYESVALPLGALVFFTLLMRDSINPGQRAVLGAARVLIIFAVIVTHHITTYLFILLLLLWAFTTVYANWKKKRQRHLSIFWTFFTALGFSTIWVLTVASATINYLGPTILSGVQQILSLIAGDSAGRELFKSGDGTTAPILEQLFGYGTTGLILLGLAIGILYIWRRYRKNPLILALGIAALGYPASMGARLTSIGVVIGGRLPEFLFIAVGFVIAFAVLEPLLKKWHKWNISLVFAGCISVIFVGGAVVGWHPATRMPGEFHVSAHGRSVDKQNLTASEWAETYLGPNNRFATDWANGLVLGSVGGQSPIKSTKTIRIANIFFPTKLKAGQQDVATTLNLDYLMVDLRLTTGLPANGVYFEAWEPGWPNHVERFDRTALTKFNHVPGINRIFDSGNLIIYDIRGWVDAVQLP